MSEKWICPVCNKENESDRSKCWECHAKKGIEGDDLRQALIRYGRVVDSSLACSNCKEMMRYAGAKSFHEGDRTAGTLLGKWGRYLLEGDVRFDLYFCPRCGKVDFFVDGIGDSDRGEPTVE